MTDLQHLFDHYEAARRHAIAILGHYPTTHEHTQRVPISDRDKRSTRYLIIKLLAQRDGPACYLCGRRLEPEQSCIEHIIPISQGGSNEPENVAISCFRCNTRKADNYVSVTVPSGRPMYHTPR